MQTNEPYAVSLIDQRKVANNRARTALQMERGDRPDVIELTESEAQMLSALDTNQRRGWMRNRPCPCGSGVKFKRCHW